MFKSLMPRWLVLASLAFILTTARAEMTLRIANEGEPETLDPQLVSGVWESRICGDLFLGLTTEAADAKTIPGAAASWNASADGLTYTFKLRDHNWSDGQPVTADDFVFAFRRILDPATAAEYASLLFIIKNAEELNKGQAKPEDLGVKALDSKTLDITLKAPAPYFIDMLTHHSTFPIPKHIVEKYGKDWIKKGNIVGNGPYVLNEWLPNTHIILDKNPKFYDAANVKIDRVIYDPNEDRGATQKAFRASELDVTKDFASDQIDWLKKNLPEETHIAPFLGIYYYAINTKKPPFGDPRVRVALSMAIDREAITDKVLKTGELPAYSFVPPGVGNYQGGPALIAWKAMPYAERIAKAKQLLTEAGFGPDKPLKFTLSYNTSENHKRIAVAVAAMWKQLGVQVELFNSEAKVHYENLQQHNFEIGRAAWIADYSDPQNFLYLLETRTGAQNYAQYSNADYDKLMQEAEVTQDLPKRASILAKAEAIAMAEQPVIPIYYYVSKNLVSKKVKGWIDNTKDIQRTRWLSVEP
ncbi:MAG: peptide ABC transporter substrate-binding protein [Gammaproteobacteria bacterium]